ncbi:MAG: purine-nucleoside phosphorylase [Gemmatimonadetes bacterium]|nr:purine-nucleoside phosphorylase [Gemmatimonadota bacterium]
MTDSAGERWGKEAADAAAAVVRARLEVQAPVAAIILGSGLGDVASRMVGARSLAYSEVPGFSGTAVVGHAGTVICGSLGGREVVALAGRFHMYEGYSAQAAAFPVRVMHALGIRVLFASNAAGALNPELVPGDLVVIDDQINLTSQNPLTGRVTPGDLRFPDMSAAYSPRLKALVMAAAGAVPLKTGVYVGSMGPTYETPAEVRMLAGLGADLTGMSTVAEAIVAAALGMEFVGVSLVTNAATGMSDTLLSHDDVVEVGQLASARFADLLEEFVARL